MEIKSVTKEQYTQFAREDSSDKFTGLFIGKCNYMDAWGKVIGYWEGEELCGAALSTLSKRKPLTTNFQLLHVFPQHRRKGIGEYLLEYCFIESFRRGAKYFRITSEQDSLEFYRKRGFKFWGVQKGGCYLCICETRGEEFSQCVYDPEDPYIKSKLFSNMKGSLEIIYDKPK